MINNINIKPIGIIYSPFIEPKGTPIQPSGASGINGKIEIFSEYLSGIKDLNGFSHIILLYYFHLINKTSLTVKPFLDKKNHGVFATRAPVRPNHIGISIVELDKVEENIIYISDVDIIDGTPLLDIKPYIPDFDVRNTQKIGWLENNIKNIKEIKDDERFIK